jgi:hypothetical protein
MTTHLTAAMVPLALSTQGLVTYLQGLFGPLFLGIVGIVAIFFLFTREITRFVQFLVLAVAIAVVFYTDAGHRHSERARSPLIPSWPKERVPSGPSYLHQYLADRKKAL